MIQTFKNKSANIDSISVVNSLLEKIIADSYTPILFIDIQGVVFDYCSESNLIDPELKKLISKVKSIDASRVIFLTDRSSQYLPMTNKQLNDLNFEENNNEEQINYNILSYDNYYSYNHFIADIIEDHLDNNKMLTLNPKTWALFIGRDSNIFPNLKDVFKRYHASSTLFRYMRNYISLLSYIPYITTKHYEIHDEDDDMEMVLFQLKTDNVSVLKITPNSFSINF